jgi:hypothetical protein
MIRYYKYGANCAISVQLYDTVQLAESCSPLLLYLSFLAIITAFELWLRTNDFEHIFIVGAFCHYSGLFKPAESHDISPNPGRSDPMYIVEAVVNK